MTLALLFGLFSTASMLWYALGERDRARLAERQQAQAFHDADRAREREAQQRRRAEAEADAARTQAAVAQATSRFLIDLLATASQIDPSEPSRATAEVSVDTVFVALLETYEALGRADLASAAQARWMAWRARHGTPVP